MLANSLTVEDEEAVQRELQELQMAEVLSYVSLSTNVELTPFSSSWNQGNWRWRLCCHPRPLRGRWRKVRPSLELISRIC